MSEDIQNLSLEAAQAEIATLRLANRKLIREMGVLQGIVERSKQAATSQASLGNFLTAEKTRQEKYMNLLLENCPDIILMFDEYGRFAYCTQAFLESANLPSFGLISGRSYQEVFARFLEEEVVERFDDAYHEAIETKHPVSIDETASFDRNETPRNYSIHIAPMLDESGEPLGALALLHDLTDILAAKRAAEQANHAKSDFLATVSHEIRTPMNAVIGLSDMLSRSELDASQHEYVSGIQNASHVLLTLINDILDFSKIEAGKLELDEAFFDLREMLSQVQNMFEVMFQDKEIEFITKIDASVPQVVYGDDKRIRQVLTNLLNNALKYTHTGHVEFSAYRDGENMVCFDVTDTGIGIKEEDIPRLFTPFDQLDRVHNKNVVGTGLGLAITDRLCKLMHGSICVVSEYGVGSTFSVALSLREGSRADLPEAAVSAVPFIAPRARILIVDDIEINLMVAEAMVESFDIPCALAFSGQEALALCETETFDLIFMDHMMPGMDGIEATQLLRGGDTPNRAAPVIALTANAVSGAREMFLASGFNDFLSKPIDRNALARCLLRWLPEDMITFV